MKSKYTTARIRKLASQAVEKFEHGDEAGFFQILDDVTRKSNIPLLRIVGEELGKAAAKGWYTDAVKASGQPANFIVYVYL